jgi:hypothetical protein
MSTLKKIIYLLMITVFISGGLKAQQSANGSKIITITNFKVYENNAQLIIDWSTAGPAEVNYWQVQSSTDGQRYNTIALVFGPDPRQQGDRYQYKGKIREAATGGKICYRVSPIDAKGQEINTEIILPAK